jgi:hypothetical protein
MSWKLGLGMTGIFALVVCGVFFAGQFLFQEKLTALPEQDQPPAVVAVNQEKPPVAEKTDKTEPVKDKILLVGVKEPRMPDAFEKSKDSIPLVEAKPPSTTEDRVKQDLTKQIELAKVEVAKGPAVISPLPIAPPLPGLPIPNPETPPSPPPPNPDTPPGPPPLVTPPPGISVPAEKAADCLWSIQLEVVKGRTIVTAKAGKDASFRIECDQVDLQSPRGCLKATGKVKITGPGLDGSSNSLTLNLQEDRLVLEGDVKVESRRDNQDLELTGDRLNLRLINTTVEAKQSSSSSSQDRAQLFNFWVGLFR